MFVIASLIDKLPNLGGIARTCEVLGIRNLVMNCKRDIEKNDFKNLRQVHFKRFNIHLHTYWNSFVTIDPKNFVYYDFCYCLQTDREFYENNFLFISHVLEEV